MHQFPSNCFLYLSLESVESALNAEIIQNVNQNEYTENDSIKAGQEDEQGISAG